MPAAGALIVLLGLAVGSFLNVVIARLPAGVSIIHPRSRCPRCLTPIGWADNIPVLSYLALGGRCRHCRQAISWRYPAVELATAALFFTAYQRIGLRGDLPAALLLIAGLIVITGIDLDHQIIPDVLTLPGIGIGLAASFLHPRITWLEAVLGVLVGGGLFFLIILASRGGMGGGDMKLGAMLGAFLGWQLALVGAVVAMLAGGVVAVGLLVARRKGRKDAVPFGPFLALGGAVSLLWGEDLLAWYLAVFVR